MTAEAKPALSPTAIALEDAAGLLTRFGKPVTVEMLQDDIDDGAPVNPDGTLNLVAYAAWLVGEMGRAD